uniref:Transmembrane protein n=1 Tax=Heterorhabditis bacteriophora TaxID=37862 RepID=A0A1I7XLT9_HETBA
MTQSASPRVPRTLSVRPRDSDFGTSSTLPNTENQRNVTIDNSQTWARFNPSRQFYLLKAVFIMMCLVDIMHWAYLLRAVVWSVRSYNRGLARVESTSEDRFFVICEFVLPSIWALLSVLIVRTMKRLRSYEQLHGYAHPPVIVLTVKNDENDESVQIEIA